MFKIPVVDVSNNLTVLPKELTAKQRDLGVIFIQVFHAKPVCTVL